MKKQSAGTYSLPVLLLILLLVASIACSLYLTEKTKTDTVIAAQNTIIKSEVQTAAGALQAIYDRSQAGEISLAYAKILGADVLRSMSYGNGGYFWADTTDGVNVVLPGNKAVEGTNRLNAEMNGVKYVQNILAAGKQPDGGFTQYWYPKKGEVDPKLKYSYSLLFKPFDWVIGTGYYMEDVK